MTGVEIPAVRSRPNCDTGGGGEGEGRVCRKYHGGEQAVARTTTVE